MSQGNIFNIQRYTIHDGPGIRTEIFLKGCPLSCKWCGNPESRAPEIQPGVYSARCIGKERCGLCKEECSFEGGLLFEEELTSINRDLCIGCMKCADICPADAIKQWGKTVGLDEVMDIIRRDVSYYESSGGGVTISGGEPLMQPEFTKDILKTCNEEGIHTCLESTFCVDRDIIEAVIPYADMLITDIKHMESAMHEKYTGVSNEKILENLSRLAKLGKPIIVRIPIVPGVNDDTENMEATADFILSQMTGQVKQLQLLPFMRLGEEKYQSLGMDYPMKELVFDRDDFQKHIRKLAEYFNRRGIPCQVGTKETAQQEEDSGGRIATEGRYGKK